MSPLNKDISKISLPSCKCSWNPAAFDILPEEFYWAKFNNAWNVAQIETFVTFKKRTDEIGFAISKYTNVYTVIIIYSITDFKDH